MSALEKINDIFSLKRFDPLNELEHDKLLELIENSSVLQFKKGQPIPVGAGKSQSVYLLSGNVVRAPNSEHAQLIEAGSSQARRAIISPGNRPRMVAGNSVTVLSVDAELLDFLLNWGAGEGVVVDEINADEENVWVDGLLRSETILSLSPQSIQTLMTAVEPIEISANEIVFNQNDEPDYYYIVSQGHCVVTHRVETKSSPIELARLGPGDAFGEEALIANTVRGATVRMLDDGLLLRLDQRNFKKLLEQSLVHSINDERAKRLQAKGAVVLDLRSAAEFSRNGSGLNVPFSELRSRIGSLDKKEKYIVVSDDNNLSAVGAFLLSKKRFKVYLLKTAIKDEIAARNAEIDEQAKQLEATVSQLQQHLNQANSRIEEEQKKHIASKERIKFLESGLKDTEDGARKAILEASTLKNRSESFLRGRINALASELEKEQQSSRSMADDNEILKNDLKSVQVKVKQVEDQFELQSVNASETQDREVSLNEQVQQLQQSLTDLRKQNEQALVEQQLLSKRFNEASQKVELKSNELNVVQEKFQTASDRLENLEHEFQNLQSRHAELENSHEQELAEKQSLNNLFNESIQTAEHQASELIELKTELHSIRDHAELVEQEIQAFQIQKTELEFKLEELSSQLNGESRRADQAEQSLQVSQEQLAEMGDSLNVSRQVGQQAKHQLRQYEKINAEQDSKIAVLTEDLRLHAQAVQQQSSLQQQLDSVEAVLIEKESHFSQIESSYQQQIALLEKELQQSAAEAKKISEQTSRHVLQNQVLSEELSILQGENKHIGTMVKSLSFVLLMLVVSVGAAYYMGIDLHENTSLLMEQAAPKFNKLFDVVPG